jgi:hypothetical protein
LKFRFTKDPFPKTVPAHDPACVTSVIDVPGRFRYHPNS